MQEGEKSALAPKVSSCGNDFNNTTSPEKNKERNRDFLRIQKGE